MPLVDQDQEHLRLLSIVYYIYARMSAFFGLFGLLYIVLGLVVAPMVPIRNGDPAFPALGVFTILVLQRLSVKALFTGNEQSMGAPLS
jgi:hypothetical protein